MFYRDGSEIENLDSNGDINHICPMYNYSQTSECPMLNKYTQGMCPMQDYIQPMYTSEDMLSDDDIPMDFYMEPMQFHQYNYSPYYNPPYMHHHHMHHPHHPYRPWWMY